MFRISEFPNDEIEEPPRKAGNTERGGYLGWLIHMNMRSNRILTGIWWRKC